MNRRLIEMLLRAVALLSLGVALVRAFGWWPASTSSAADAPLVVTATRDASAQLLATMRRAQSSTRVRGVHLSTALVPNDTARALLSAARSAGVPVSWTDSTRGAAVAIEADALVDPRGGVSVRVGAPDGVVLGVSDTLGLVDSVRAASGGATLRLGRASGMLAAVSSATRARVPQPDAPIVRRLLLVARPGWEAKFTLAALEECGWQVDAKFSVAPRVNVTQGAPEAPDTARYAAVVALDSSVLSMASQLARFVQSGGGLVLAGEATTLPAMQSMLPGASATRQPGVPGGLLTATPRVGLARWPIAVHADAVVLERGAGTRQAQPVVAARRIGHGRVVQVGYDALWEWRMQGGEGSVAAHRDWWGRLVSGVAFAPAVANTNVATSHLPGDVAPYADLVARLGASMPMPVQRGINRDPPSPEPWLFVIAALALLAEWGSRRMRGER